MAVERSDGRGSSTSTRRSSSRRCMARLDQAFPEFGWRRDARGWVATNNSTPTPGSASAPNASSPMSRTASSSTAARRCCGPPTSTAAPSPTAPSSSAPSRSSPPAPASTRARSSVRRADRRARTARDFFTLAGCELLGDRGASTRVSRAARLPADALERAGLGVVPPAETKRRTSPRAATGQEIKAAGVLADTALARTTLRRLAQRAGEDRHASGRATIDDRDRASSTYAAREDASAAPTACPTSCAFRSRERRELVLVEGLLDVHHLRAQGIANIAAIGSAHPAREPRRLPKHGIETVTWPWTTTSRPRRPRFEPSIERAASQTPRRPGHRPRRLGTAKDPDAYVRKHGVDRSASLVGDAECATTWRTLDPCAHLTPTALDTNGELRSHRPAGGSAAPAAPRPRARGRDLGRLGALRLRPEAVDRAFRARSGEATRTSAREPCRSVQGPNSITPSTCERPGHPHPCSAIRRMALRPARALSRSTSTKP